MSATHPASVQTSLELRLLLPDGSAIAVPARLRYDTTDPFAVDAVFRAGSAGDPEITWTFARALLTDGLLGPVGDGDVHIGPDTDERHDPVISLTLQSPSGSARFALPHAAVLRFLERTYAEVPPGTEADWLNLDSELDSLLHAGGR